MATMRDKRLQIPLAVLAVAAMLLCTAPAEARRRGGGGYHGGSGSSHGSSSHTTSKDSGSSLPGIHIRSSGGSGNQAAGGSGFAPQGSSLGPLQRIDTPMTPEEAERKAATMAALEKARAEKAAIAAAEADAARRQLEKLAEERAAQAAAQERLEAERQQAALEQRKRADALLAAEVESVLERAMGDYPVLRTPAGQHWVEAIRARQKVLQERGLYPSVAMVEAVADHGHVLAPRRPALVPVALSAAAREPAPAPREIGNCRWRTPVIWACD